MKICIKCKIEKEEINFTQSQLKKKNSKCKSCISTYNKKWREENPEKVKTWAKENSGYQKKWVQDNPEKVAATQKRWRQKNPEKALKWAKENAEKANERSKKWALENPEKIKENSKKHYQNNTKKVNERSKKWALENPEKVRAKSKKWRKNNPEKAKANTKRWFQANIEKINTKRRERCQNNPIYRNRKIASNMVNQMLKSQGYSKGGESSGDYFPWTSEEYKVHIESLFEPWMNWSNQGVYNPKTHHLPEKRTWQLDHIIPQSDLPYPTMDHPNFNKTWNLSNLRPLDAKQNVLDGANRTRHQKGQK